MLSDQKKREVYDKFGEEGLKGSAHGPGGGQGGDTRYYEFHGDPRATFAQFFGTSSPFQTFFDLGGTSSFMDDEMDVDLDPFSFMGPRGVPGGGGGAFRSHSFNIHGNNRSKDKVINSQRLSYIRDF